MKTLNTIAVAVDFDEEVDDILKLARDLAKGTGASLHIVHIFAADPDVYLAPYTVPLVEEAEHEEELQAESAWVKKLVQGLRAEGLLVAGCMRPLDDGVAHSILEFAKEQEADLILLGSHQPGRMERLVLGSVAEEVLRKAAVPVLVVPRSRGEE